MHSGRYDVLVTDTVPFQNTDIVRNIFTAFPIFLKLVVRQEVSKKAEKMFESISLGSICITSFDCKAFYTNIQSNLPQCIQGVPVETYVFILYIITFKFRDLLKDPLNCSKISIAASDGKMDCTILRID
ncbi:hypothetical protein RF11_16477 [Thelohanellus kitauei]|uniref:Uncharacterized protein n=1 Tax=Thelohanellus kitauei TaxID=669202 RepID=A0A0C2NBG3_THEKT|nr:hypothetical protein RF11_16477 [Thelohanellus kitauei]